MTIKQFGFARIITAASLAAVLSQAIVLKNYYLSSAAIIIAVLLLLYLKKQVKEITADERDYQIAGEATRWTLTVFGILGALGSFILLTARAYNPYFEAAGSTLAYAVCALLMIDGLLVSYLRYRGSEIPIGKKIIMLFVAITLASMLTIFGIRLFSGEDTWICQNGQWTVHGQPSLPAPERPCQ